MNRKAIVTGVSRLKGIGRAVCIELARSGVDIFFSYWMDYDRLMPWKTDVDEPLKIKSEIEEIGVNCSMMELDLSKEGSSEKLFDEAYQFFGVADILVNNAAYSMNNNIFTIEPQELDMHYKVNLKNTLLLCKEFANRYSGNSGRIINMISGQELGEMDDELAYAVTKSAVKTLTRTISHQLAERMITVNAVNPGPTDTGWMTTELEKQLKNKFPSGRIGLPEDAAKLIAFLSGIDSGWITGQTINSEGGFNRG